MGYNRGLSVSAHFPVWQRTGSRILSKNFKKAYPGIDYELLLGDYTEIEAWISEGRVDCGFLRLPTDSDFETIFLEQDRLLAILPENHALTQLEKVPVAALCEEPFMLLEKGAKTEVSEIFERCNLINAQSTFYNVGRLRDYVNGGKRSWYQYFTGIDIFLKRVPYRIAAKRIRCARIPENRDCSAERIKRRLHLQSSGSWNICNIVKILYRKKVYKQRIYIQPDFQLNIDALFFMK